MTQFNPADVQSWLSVIHDLAFGIGPRGSTTPGERKGAEYCQAYFEHLGLQPIWESYTSATSIFAPHLYSSVGMLIAFSIYPWAGRESAWVAAILSLVLVVSEILELGFIPNPLRWIMSKGESQNVHVAIPPSGEHRRDLLLVGHIDTQRTPLIFHNSRWVEAYKAFTNVAFVMFIFQIVLFSSGAVFQWDWIWLACIPSVLCALLLGVICLEADSSHFTAGANDNASAVGLVLTFAARFSKEPLEHTRVICLCSGCEEVGHYGAIDFFQRHRSELNHPRALVFELVGVSGPGWLTQEGIIVPFHSDPEMRALAEKLSGEHPEWGAYPVKINGGNSELADCVRFKVPAITFFGLTSKGEAPYWHQAADTADKMDPTVMQHTGELVWEMIKKLDT